MNNFSELAEIEQLILQMNQKPNNISNPITTIPKANDIKQIIPTNSRSNHNVASITFTVPPSEYKNNLGYNPQDATIIRQSIDKLQKRLIATDQNRLELGKMLSVSQANINNKIEAIKNQLNYNKDRIQKLQAHNFERMTPFLNFKNKHDILIEDSKYYFQKIESISGNYLSRENNEERTAIEGSQPAKRSKSKNYPQSEKMHKQVVFPPTPKLKKTKAKPFKK